MLQAMNTGHDGSITTVHSNSPRDTLSRIETMTLMAGMDLPVRVIREQMASALDLIVHLTRLRDGTRRVTHVSEVMGMEGDVVVLQDIYTFDFAHGHRRGRQVPRCASRAPASARRSPSGSTTTASRSSRRCSRATPPVRQRAAARDDRRCTVLAASRQPSKIVFAVLVAAAVLAFALALIFMSADQRGQDRTTPRRPHARRDPVDEEDDEFVPKPARPGAAPRPRSCSGWSGITGRLADRAGLLTAHRGRARAGRPAAAPAGSAVLLLRRRLRGRAARRLLVLPIPVGARARRWSPAVGPGRSCCTAGGRSACASSRCSCPTR